ncbi:hypothetical protein KP806_07430 [Paenibacillus sp. N4]|uniref:hypothetical protein n=1 Tax=Paenibacillus vietnamensis TaxID=2590547 RepID=UPI001CD0A340|nr:hypothetical protein [Paenibacillus vietnamensis]MCA0754877.1 hypothetical protein [Paenibacillus vietnamensis]
MSNAEKARQLVDRAKRFTRTYREVMQTIRVECVVMPAGSDANDVYDHAMSILFSEMYDAPHGGVKSK